MIHDNLNYLRERIAVLGNWFQGIAPARGPARTLCVGGFVTAIGDGAWYTVWAIYFTRIVHLPAAQVGIGLAIAGAVALAAITPLGHLADQLGLRGTLMAVTGVQAVAMACFPFVRSFWPFLAVAVVATATDQSASGIRNALVSGLITGQQRFDTLAQERSAHQLGFTLGAALGAVTLAIDSRPAFVALILLNAASTLIYAASLARLPRVSRQQGVTPGWRLPVLRDTSYMAVIGLTAILALCWGMLSTGVPLWITHHTHAHLYMAAVIILVNTAAIAVFQVRVSRDSELPRRCARKAVYSGGALAASCLLFAMTDQGRGWLVVVLLLCAGLAQLVGELFFVAALWGLSIGLMPPGAAGQYQGMATTGVAVAQMLSPVIMIALLVTWGFPGWFALAGLFAAAAAAAIPTTAWALRHRPAPPALLSPTN
jgi:hypothetical protein